MMEEGRRGVEAIVIGDMSWLGRDYLKVGQVRKFAAARRSSELPSTTVDSLKGDDDFTLPQH